jgi:hypothetical protein
VIHRVDSDPDSSTGSREATKRQQTKRKVATHCPLVLLIKAAWRQGKVCGSEISKVKECGLLRECIRENKVGIYCMVAESCCKKSGEILQRYIKI